MEVDGEWKVKWIGASPTDDYDAGFDDNLLKSYRSRGYGETADHDISGLVYMGVDFE